MKCGSIQQRWILSFLTAIVMFLKYTAQTSSGVALVAMVNATDIRLHSTNVSFRIFGNHTEVHKEEGLSINVPVYNWSRQMQGYILSAFYFGSLTMKLFAGGIAQRYGGKWVIGTGIFGFAVVELLIPLTARAGPYAMIAMFAIHGMISSILWPSVFAMYGRWIPPQEISVLSAMADVGLTFGQFFGLVLSGPICSSQTLGGWPTIFYLNGSLCFLVLFFWCLLVSSSPDDHPYISSDELDYIQKSLKSKQHEVNQSGVPWRRILFNRITTSLIIGSFGFGWVIYMSSTVLPQYFSDVLHLPIHHNSIMLSLTALTNSFTLIGYAHAFDLIIRREWLQKTFLRKLYVVIGSVVVGCVYVIISSTYLGSWTVVCLFIVGLSSFQLASLTFNVMPLDLSPEYSGTLSGISTGCMDLGGMLMPIIIDSLTTYKTKSEWNIMFYLSCAVVSGCSLTYVLFGTAERQYQWSEKNDDDVDLLHDKHATEASPFHDKSNTQNTGTF